MNGDDSAKSPLSELEELREQLKKVEEDRERERAEKEKAKEELKMKDQQISKLNTQIRGKTGYIAEGTITWPVEVKDMGLEKEKEIFSPPVVIGGFPFHLGTYQRDFGILSLPRIAFHPYLHCSTDTPVFTHFVEGEYTVRLVSSVPGKEEPLSECFSFTHYNPQSEGQVLCCFFWDDVMNPANGFLQDGRITFEVKLKVLCNYKNVHADFLPDSLSDVTLIVGEQKFHSNKAYLAHHCGFFKALFFSDFAEKDQKEVELKDINPKEFECFLRVLYPERGEIRDTNVAAMLRLADYFDAYSVRRECKYFLMQSRSWPLSDVDKLLLSEEFGLFEIQNNFVDGMADGEDGFETIKRAIKSDKFKDLPERLQVLLLQKHAWLAGMELAVASKQ